ncbi:MAG: aminodeoxychorismate lyase [Pseudonocardiaceae bacterium]|nr:aminodeoxychorismate lyase [Pseudonocardiaceae bacterium]
MTERVLALLDGTLADPEAPLLRADDLGVVRGDGLFETILVIDGVALELEPHLARLARSAAMLDLPEPDLDAWRSCAHTVIDAWRGGREMVLKLVLTRGPEGAGEVTGFATGAPVPASLLAQRRDGIAAVTLTRGIAPDLAGQAPWLLLGAKTLSYAMNMAALRHAATRGGDDVIFTATDGSVLEGPTSTVVIAQGATLRTPPAETGILSGTTQGALFRSAAAAGWHTSVEPIAVDELATADGVWLVSSIRRIARVRTLDGIRLPDAGLTSELGGMLRDAALSVAGR